MKLLPPHLRETVECTECGELADWLVDENGTETLCNSCASERDPTIPVECPPLA